MIEGDEFARKIGGEFPRQSFILVEGPNGLGKSVVAQRIAYSVALNNQTVTYFSSELSVASFMNQMNSLGYDVKEYLLNKKLKYVSLYSSLYSVPQDTQVLEILLRDEELLKSDLIVFDAMDELFLNQPITKEYLFNLISFFRKIANKGSTILFSIDKENADPQVFDMLAKLSEVYISLFIKTVYDNEVKVMKINRFMGATNDFPEELPFKVRAKMGIIIDISS